MRTGETLFALTDAGTIAVDARLGNEFTVTITASRSIGTPTNPTSGQEITFFIKQNGTGGWQVFWPAVFKGLTWSDTGNTANKRTSISFVYDGTDWNQKGAQSPYA